MFDGYSHGWISTPVAAAAAMPVLIVTALIAQIDAMGSSASALTAIVSALSGGGFAVWMGWHVLTKTLPEMQARHEAAIQKIMNAHGEQLAAERELFRQEFAMNRSDLAAERVSRERDASRISEQLNTLIAQGIGGHDADTVVIERR